MQVSSLVRVILSIGVLVLVPPLLAQEKATLPADPTAAWEEVQKVHEALVPPHSWRTQAPTPEQVAEFQKQVRQAAISFAEKAREFIKRFPNSENVGDARLTLVHALTHAIAAGDADAEKQVATFVSTVLADKKLSEDDRVRVLLYSGNAAFMKRVGMRVFTEGMSKLDDEMETVGIESMRAALKQFPTNSMIFTLLVAVAQRSTGERQKELARDIRNAPGAAPGAKALADHILNGTKPYEVGKPLDIRFTALDGREVDLAKLKGKVVLIEFWSTTCGPCIAELPKLKAAYDKLHDQGFEVVGISLDDKESALRRFIKEKDLPWPQHYDGKAWENLFAVRYGIFGIPTAWLVDKRGNLRDVDSRNDLERRVTTLLAERTSN